MGGSWGAERGRDQGSESRLISVTGIATQRNKNNKTGTCDLDAYGRHQSHESPHARGRTVNPFDSHLMKRLNHLAGRSLISPVDPKARGFQLRGSHWTMARRPPLPSLLLRDPACLVARCPARSLGID